MLGLGLLHSNNNATALKQFYTRHTADMILKLQAV